MAAAGVTSKVLSGAANVRADTRTWDNLPQYLGFATLRLPQGPHSARLEHFSANGQILP